MSVHRRCRQTHSPGLSLTPRLTGGKQVRETNPGAVRAHRETAQDHRGTHRLLNTISHNPVPHPPRGKLVHRRGDYA